jgi:hypothetical protein
VLHVLPSPGAGRRALALLVIVTALLPLWRGGVDWPVQLAATALAAGALAFAAGHGRNGLPPVVVGLAAAALWSALQLLPLPSPALRLLSPSAHRLFVEQLGPIGLYPAARPLSLDPPATGRELAKLAACLLVALAGSHFAASRRRKELLLGALVLAGALAAAAGLVAAALGSAPLLESKLVFVNPNHLAAFLELSAFVGLGFGVRSHGRGRLLWLLAFAVSTSGVFLSLSRGGIAGFFCGLTLFSFLSLRRAPSSSDQPASWRVAVSATAVAVGLGVAAYLALDPILAELASLLDARRDVKVALWPIAVDLLRQFPVTGIGRGSFATAFAAYKLGPEPVTFTHLENEWLQAPIDLGLVVGLALIAGAAFTWWTAARQRDLSRPEIGALAGVAALVLHDTVDFSLELLGVALPFALMLGLLSRHRILPAAGRLAQRIGALAALVLAALGMTLYVNHPTDADARRVAAAPDAAAAVALAREAARWHPADFVPQAAAGIQLVREGRCAEALPWLTRAMLLDPTGPEAHLHAARCLAAGKKDALAKREYRLAFLLGDRAALTEAAQRFPSVLDLLEVAPDSPQGLSALGALLAAERPGDAVLVFQRSWDAFGDVDALGWLAQLALSGARNDEALRLARTLREKRPDAALPYLVAATALTRLGRAGESRQELELGAARLPGSAPILNVLSQRAVEAHRYAEAQALAERIVTSSLVELAHKKLLLASILSTQGRTGEAVSEALGARAALPQEAWTHLSVAAYLAQAGRYDEAISAVEGAAGLPNAAAHAYDGRIQELRRARDAQRLRLLENESYRSSAEAPRLP